MAIIVLPIGIDFNTWANQLWIDLPGRDIPQADKEMKWRDFACQLYTNPNLVNTPYPDETTYPGEDGWKLWAQDFVNNIYL